MNDQQNPYQAPTVNPAPATAAISESLAAGSLRLASQNQRFLGYLVDFAIYYGVCFLAGMFLGILLVITGQDIETSPLFQGFGPNLVALTVFFVCYFGIEAVTGGRSVGKFLTGTKVVGADGQPASLGQFAGRALCRFIPFDAFSFLGGKGRPVGWHDNIPGTRVITLK